ncbi:phosphoadenylyl-sulfate reductase [Saccharomonospora piscinae]|uniref:phosphoadenylyl-sulfate reductase n=1 Tax=Saccharomonospora piscinae TaxID=687388 RepID=UPI0011061043|nr:phosphoadenylyl-sulfate reductase [Saccharomonospora piscinae]TLW91217.1 phosphoadenylyl-sulfate reductase [Saccharomonospora piscinae]
MTAAASRDELKALADEASVRLSDAGADEALRWAVEQFGDHLIVAANMQDAVLVDLVTKVKPDVDVLFLDTGYHFAETIGTRDAVATVYPEIRIVNATPEQTVPEQDAEYGANLFERDPNQCCHLRKVIPLRRTLGDYQCWITGVRRADAPTRADTPIVTWDDRNGLVKVNPIAAWTDDEFDDYLHRHGVLQNALVSEGYPSIGCAPCTAKVAPGADPRSGRWAGSSKTECGLHA